MEYHKVKMHLTPQGFGSVIVVDGMEVKSVTGITVTAGADEPTTVTISFYAEVEADGDSVVQVVPVET